MLQDMMGLFPSAVNTIPAGTVAVIACVGAALALLGARFSRAILSLAMVAVGTVVGLQMPKWFGWGIDPMGTAFGAAALLGLAGFALWGFWEALLLGLLCAAWAGAITWLALVPGTTWQYPHLNWQMTAGEMAFAIWASLPTEANKELAIALGVGMLLGELMSPLWPRLGRVLLYSVGGLTCFVFFGGLYAQRTHPKWIEATPSNNLIQIGIFAGAILLSALMQWLLLPKPRKKKPGGEVVRPEDAPIATSAPIAPRPRKLAPQTLPLEDWPPQTRIEDRRAAKRGADPDRTAMSRPAGIRPSGQAPEPFDLADEPAPQRRAPSPSAQPDNVREPAPENPPPT